VRSDRQSREEEAVADGVNDESFPPRYLKHEMISPFLLQEEGFL
jgi:hypothetical protein